MNDAFSESATGAAGTQTISISRVCCAGKNAQEHIPQSAIAARNGYECPRGRNRVRNNSESSKGNDDARQAGAPHDLGPEPIRCGAADKQSHARRKAPCRQRETNLRAAE